MVFPYLTFTLNDSKSVISELNFIFLSLIFTAIPSQMIFKGVLLYSQIMRDKSIYSVSHVNSAKNKVRVVVFTLRYGAVGKTVKLFQFLRDFLENVVAQSYTVEWKRSAFFRFVEHFPSPNMSQELKSKILQMILIPCFAQSFERGEGEKLVGSPASPDQDNPDNVVSVFISKVSIKVFTTD